MSGEPASLLPTAGAMLRAAPVGTMPISDAAGDDVSAPAAFQHLLRADSPAQQAPTSGASPSPASGERLSKQDAEATAASEAMPDTVNPMLAMFMPLPGLPAVAEATAASKAMPDAVNPMRAMFAQPSGLQAVAEAVAASPAAVGQDPLAGVGPYPAAAAASSSLPHGAVTDAIGAALRPRLIDPPPSASAGDTTTPMLPPILRTASPGIIPPALAQALQSSASAAPVLTASAFADAGASAGLAGATASQPTSQGLPLPSSMPVPASTSDTGIEGIPAVSMAWTLARVPPDRAMAADAPIDPVALLQALQATQAEPHTDASEAAGAEAASLGVPHVPAMLAASAAPATPATLSASSLTLAQPADPNAGYDDRLGDHLAWMAAQRLSHAQIRVAPEHLGPIDIRVQVDGREVRAEFHSPHAEVRQTLEASLPRLRELLAQQGLQLTHAGVGQGQPQERRAGSSRVPLADGNPTEDPLPVPPRLPEIRRGRGLLDEYA